MKYMGSKRRIAKHILPIILKDRKPEQYYVEPFCGGCKTLDKVTGPRIASDSNFYLIQMWKALQTGWLPPDNISEELYKDIKANKDSYHPELVGFALIGCSFSAKWADSYARNVSKSHPNSEELNNARNYGNESKRGLIPQIPYLKDVQFFACDYDKLPLPENSLIYCDPPYANTAQYHQAFDSEKFWDWCRDTTLFGHKLFVSEYSAPADFTCVWEGTLTCNINPNLPAKKKTERLFTYKISSPK